MTEEALLGLRDSVRIVQRKTVFLADEFSIKTIATPVHDTSFVK